MNEDEDEPLEQILAVCAAHETTTALIFQAILSLAGVEDGTPERKEVLQNWSRDSQRMLDGTNFPGFPSDMQERIITRAKRNVSDLFEALDQLDEPEGADQAGR
jgi:UDP-N-acetylglucosamine enolpyruvyl transferase